MITMSIWTVAGFAFAAIQFAAGAYFIGRSQGIRLVIRERKEAIEVAEPEVEVISDIAPLVMRYRETAQNAAVIHGQTHDWVFVWCKDGLHHGMNVKPGEGDMLVKLLGLKPLALPVAFSSGSPRKSDT